MLHNKNITSPPSTPILESEKEKFSMGVSDEVINIRALQNGKQIILCKAHKKSTHYIFLVAKKSFKSKFEPSVEGRKLMHSPIVESDITRHIAKIDYLTIPGKNRSFWQELYDEQEFNLWSIDNGPLKYFKSQQKSDKMYLWIFRVYEMPFEIKAKADFKLQRDNATICNPNTLKRIRSGFDNGEFTPVLSDADFHRRATRIKEIADKDR